MQILMPSWAQTVMGGKAWKLLFQPLMVFTV